MEKSIFTYLRSKGVRIGKDCTIGPVDTISIDISRPYLLEIGDQVRLNRGLTIMTHDFATIVFKNKYGEFIPSSGKVKIGNNVYFGHNCTVLKGVEIGDNCIIGYGSTVMKSIPANSVAVGTPAKVICTLDEYFEKRKKKALEESFCLVNEIEKVCKREVKIEDLREEFVYFVSGNEIDNYPQLPIYFQLQYVGNCLERWRKKHKALFSSFEDFIQAAHEYNKKNK